MIRTKNVNITKEFLDSNPLAIFVFGDNAFRVGNGGAAILRDHPQSYGFVTKVHPSHNPNFAYYKPENYMPVFEQEVYNLIRFIKSEPGMTFYVSKVGAGLANEFGIWEAIIEPNLPEILAPYPNVVLLWD